MISPSSTTISTHEGSVTDTLLPKSASIQVKKEVGVCGISNLPNQTHFLTSRIPITFNILLMGEPNCGKRTFINKTLGCEQAFPSANPEQLESDYTDDADSKGAVGIRVRERRFIDGGIKATIRLVDIPLVGYSVTKADGYRAIGDYVEDQLQGHLQKESLPDQRSARRDDRIHVCLFWINAHQKQLSQIDLAALQRLNKLTNVILVIGQADMLTEEEMKVLKGRLLKQLSENNIQSFSMDKEAITIYAASNRNVQNPEFSRLQSNLLRTFLPHLLDQTENYYYEGYRRSNPTL